MKATVHMEIDVDTEAWEAEYGTRALEDVENYLLNHLLQSPAAQADGFEITGFAVHPA
jgi:hypothetical protein